MNAPLTSVSLDDKYGAEDGTVYLTGIQALVRVAIDRIRRDRRLGLKTGGFVSGYRGSPVGGLDIEFAAQKKRLDDLGIVFQPGVNEELGATAVWGTQKLGLGGDTDYDGVFGMWYGKAPGVDRTGDVFKHANASGTALHGGVLAIAGDDHLAKSSTMGVQSEFAFIDAEIPVLNPADLQDVLDYGLHGLAMSRYSGLWTALIALADTMDSSGIISVDPDRIDFLRPRDHHDPRLTTELNRALGLGNRLEAEALMRGIKLPAAKAYVHANGLDGIRFGAERPRFGIVATGKAYRDLRQALALIGIDHDRAAALGLAIYKVAMPWPLEPLGISGFTRDLERLMVVEHKRALIEPQIKELLYHRPAGQRPPVFGKTTPDGAPFLQDVQELSPRELLPALLSFLPDIAGDPQMRAAAERIEAQSKWAAGNAEKAQRMPYFCSGCPHSTSTRTPEGSRAMPGIGCHAMAEMSGRITEGLVAMGGEGVPWVGQAPFSKDGHMFVNLGDGTFYHSGSLAIRQAVAANVSATFKILFNDAVAMTGGQPHDGPLTVPQITRMVAAEGVKKIVVVSERPQLYGAATDLAPGVTVHDRRELLGIETDFAEYPGVSVIVYDQTCAAEKRRRRKTGAYENPARRLFINDRVCEACGDCSVASNCVSVEPLATAFGEKRRINQSSCNKDYSCSEGFCPSFVVVDGAEPRRAAGDIDLSALTAKLGEPERAALDAPINLLITGIGGTGVTTVAAVLAMAAHIDGLNVTTLDMTGIAQKGGPVTSHVRFARGGAPIEGPRVPAASLDVLIAADPLVAGGAEALTLMNPARTKSIANRRIAPTAEFVIRQSQSHDAGRIEAALDAASAKLVAEDVSMLAEALFGDAILANTMLLGMALEAGALPVSLSALQNAIRLNGAMVERNLQALAAGRLLVADRAALIAKVAPPQEARELSLDERIDFLARELAAYQNAAYGERYRARIAEVRAADAARGREDLALTRAVAENLYRLMAVKDEYEVARLYAAPEFREKLAAQFAPGARLRVKLSPPFFAGTDKATGRPRKFAFGPWIFPAFKLLAALKPLRGTLLDPFARLAERRAERALLSEYEGDIKLAVDRLGAADYDRLVAFLGVPDAVRGFGPVKMAALEKAKAKRLQLLSALDNPPAPETAPARPRQRVPAGQEQTIAAE